MVSGFGGGGGVEVDEGLVAFSPAASPLSASTSSRVPNGFSAIVLFVQGLSKKRGCSLFVSQTLAEDTKRPSCVARGSREAGKRERGEVG